MLRIPVNSKIHIKDSNVGLLKKRKFRIPVITPPFSVPTFRDNLHHGNLQSIWKAGKPHVRSEKPLFYKRPAIRHRTMRPYWLKPRELHQMGRHFRHDPEYARLVQMSLPGGEPWHQPRGPAPIVELPKGYYNAAGEWVAYPQVDWNTTRASQGLDQNLAPPFIQAAGGAVEVPAIAVSVPAQHKRSHHKKLVVRPNRVKLLPPGGPPPAGIITPMDWSPQIVSGPSSSSGYIQPGLMNGPFTTTTSSAIVPFSSSSVFSNPPAAVPMLVEPAPLRTASLGLKYIPHNAAVIPPPRVSVLRRPRTPPGNFMRRLGSVVRAAVPVVRDIVNVAAPVVSAIVPEAAPVAGVVQAIVNRKRRHSMVLRRPRSSRQRPRLGYDGGPIIEEV